ncbi:sensor histidine kinase [Archangium sp.]|uniref:sensor histidine kinase n=1 Tax=Archangium sp. TaxID=1872627 RepID=UPI002ED77E21
MEQQAPGDPASTSRPRRTQIPRVFPVVVLGSYGLDVIVVGGFRFDMLAVRIVWALFLAVYPWMLKRSSDGQARLLAVFHGLLSGGAGLALAIFAGGVNSPYVAFLPGWQLVVTLLYQRGIIEIITSGVVGAIGAFMLMHADGRSHSISLTWSAMVVSSTFFGLYCCSWLFKMQAAEHQARLERARRESLEALALSERRRTQSEKLAVIGRIAAGVMHEINNPLSYVRANLDFLQREMLAGTASSNTSEVAEVIAETREGVDHIHRIAGDLKGFSRMDTEEASECALADVVGDALKLASVRLKHVAALNVDVPKDLPEVFAVRRKLAQVVLNLLVNAGDALEEQQVEQGEVWVKGRAEGERVVLLIEDNGPGFASHVLPRLFENFFTTKTPDKGTGLGLPLSRELVTQFGGVLTAENRPEGGARLRLEFPCRPAGSRAKQQSGSFDAVSPRGAA